MAEPSAENVRARLESQRAEIEATIARIERQDRSNTAAGELDNAQEWEDAEVREGQMQALRAELADFDAAFRRLERGGYGVCARCGARIADERLQVLPATALCAACAGS
jgi:RNA polymerase-binding transcription factor DksA